MGFTELYLCVLVVFLWTALLRKLRPGWPTLRWIPWATAAGMALAAVTAGTGLGLGAATGIDTVARGSLRTWERSRDFAFLAVGGGALVLVVQSVRIAWQTLTDDDEAGA